MYYANYKLHYIEERFVLGISQEYQPAEIKGKGI